MSIFGNVQSGKSAAILEMCFECIMNLGLIPLVILRNSKSEAKQFLTRFKEKRIEERLLKSQIDIIEIDGNTKEAKQEKKIYMAIGNNSRMRTFIDKIYNRLSSTDKQRFVIICDEADDILYHATGFNTKTSDYILQMRRECYKYAAVTATIDCIIYCEKNCRMCDIFLLDMPDDYKGIEYLNFITNEHLNRVPNAGLCNMIPFMSTLHGIFNREEEHTKMILVNMEYRISQQDSFVVSRSMFVNEENNNKIIYMSMNSSSYTISTDICLSDYPLENHRIFDQQSYGNGRYIYKIKDTFHLPMILDFFESLEEYEIQIDTIVLLVRHKAGRGLSFVNSSRRIHITDIISCDRADLTTLYQSMRIFGRFQDDHKLQFHGSTQCAVDLKTILHKNEQTFKYIRVYKGNPVALLENRLDLVKINKCVYVNGIRYEISEKRIVPKQKGDIRIKLVLENDRQQKYGGYELRHNEFVEDAIEKVFNGMEIGTITNTTMHIPLNRKFELPPIGQRTGENGRAFKNNIRIETIDTIENMPLFGEKERILDALKNNKSLIGGNSMELRIFYNNNLYAAAMFKHPKKRARSYKNISFASDGESMIVTLNGNDEIYNDDDVITWHDIRGKRYFNIANIGQQQQPGPQKNTSVNLSENIAQYAF